MSSATGLDGRVGTLKQTTPGAGVRRGGDLAQVLHQSARRRPLPLRLRLRRPLCLCRCRCLSLLLGSGAPVTIRGRGCLERRTLGVAVAAQRSIFFYDYFLLCCRRICRRLCLRRECDRGAVRSAQIAFSVCERERRPERQRALFWRGFTSARAAAARRVVRCRGLPQERLSDSRLICPSRTPYTHTMYGVHVQTGPNLNSGLRVRIFVQILQFLLIPRMV